MRKTATQYARVSQTAHPSFFSQAKRQRACAACALRACVRSARTRQRQARRRRRNRSLAPRNSLFMGDRTVPAMIARREITACAARGWRQPPSSSPYHLKHRHLFCVRQQKWEVEKPGHPPLGAHAHTAYGVWGTVCLSAASACGARSVRLQPCLQCARCVQSVTGIRAVSKCGTTIYGSSRWFLRAAVAHRSINAQERRQCARNERERWRNAVPGDAS